MTPIHCPLSFLERSPASKPTEKTTVLRMSLREDVGQVVNQRTIAGYCGGGAERSFRGSRSKKGTTTYAFMRNCMNNDEVSVIHTVTRNTQGKGTYPRSAILEDLPLRLRVLRRGFGDRVLHSLRRHCGAILFRISLEEVTNNTLKEMQLQR